jgi:hypothetical protein
MIESSVVAGAGQKQGNPLVPGNAVSNVTTDDGMGNQKVRADTSSNVMGQEKFDQSLASY